MSNAEKNENEKNSSAKQNFDREAKTGHPPDDHPISGGPLSAGHYQTSANGARSSKEQQDLTLRSAAKAGVASGVPESPNKGPHQDDGTALAALRNQLRQIQAEVRDRNEGFADEERNNADAANVEGETSESQAVSDAEMRELIARLKLELRKSRIDIKGTTHPYGRDVDRLMRAYNALDGDFRTRCRGVLQQYAESSNSFFKYRAAWAWAWRCHVWALVKQLAALGSASADDPEVQRIRQEIKKTLAELEVVQGVKRQDLLAEFGKKARKTKSKRNELKYLPEDWKAQVLKEAMRSPTYRLLLYVLSTIGCRPAELQSGIEISFVGDNAEILVRQGAKVSATSGQPWRKFTVPQASIPEDVRKYIQEGGGKLTLNLFSKDGLRAFLRQVSLTLGFEKVVSPYSFRHAVAEELRSQGAPAHEIATALGQVVAQTSSMYGRKIRHRGKQTRKTDWNPSEVEAPKAVKPLPTFDASAVRRKQSGAKPGPKP